MKKIMRYFLSHYEESDWLLQRKATTMLILHLSVISLIIIELLLSSLILNKLPPEFYPNISIVLILIISIFCLKKGKYELSAGLGIVSAVGGITWTRFHTTGLFSDDVSYDFTQYVLDLVLILLYANLVGKTRKFIAQVFLILALLLSVYTYVLLRLEDVNIHPYFNSVIYSGFAFFILAGIGGWLSFKQNKISIEKAKMGEQRYHTLFANAHDAIFIIKGDRFSECNPQTLSMFGGNKDEIIGKTPQYFSPKRQPDGMDSEVKAHHLLERAMDGTPQRFEWLHTRIDGGLFFADVSLYRMELSGETLLVAAVRDISEKKRLEKEVYKSYITGEENERTRIAKELHDGLGPLLSACKIYHYNLGTDRLNADDRVSHEKMGTMLNESMISIKEISNNLSPHVLRNFGLIVAIKNFKENIRTDCKFIIECHCDESKRYDELFEVTLYRVLTELIHNSIKHAGASEIGIYIDEINNVFLVNYYDNGKGFDFDEALKKSGGLGLLNMQSRIHSLGGEIVFHSRKEGGVSVTISINL